MKKIIFGLWLIACGFAAGEAKAPLHRWTVLMDFAGKGHLEAPVPYDKRRSFVLKDSIWSSCFMDVTTTPSLPSNGVSGPLISASQRAISCYNKSRQGFSVTVECAKGEGKTQKIDLLDQVKSFEAPQANVGTTIQVRCEPLN